MMGLFKRRGERPVSAVVRAVMETLEERRLLSTPHVLTAGPRESRPDYMTSTMDGGFPTAPEHFEWEYTTPKLVYPFDQPVAGVNNQTHTVTTLYDQVLLRHDPYPLTTSVVVSGQYYDRTATIASTDGGQSWNGTLEDDGFLFPAMSVSLTTNSASPEFYLTLTTDTGMTKFALSWDGYDQIQNHGRVEYTGDGNTYYFYNLGSDGYYTVLDTTTPGSAISLPNPTFNATGDTATVQLPTDLPTGNYEAILTSSGITDMGGSNHLDGDATTTEADDLHEDFVYPFFIMPGDANHDRVINIDDYGRIDGHGSATNGYINGDFNYDNLIDPNDYFIIDHNFGTVLPPMPTEPNTLTAFASRDGQSVAQMTLNWVPPTDVPDMDGFGVWCSTDGGVTFNFLDFVQGGDSTSYQRTGLQDGTKYTYRIRAHSPTGGYSTTSNKVWAVTNLPGPGKLMVSNFTGSAVTLAWPDNAGTEDRYDVMMRVNGGDWELLDTLSSASGTGSELTYAAGGIDPLAHSEFKVEAVNSAQRSSPAMWDDEAYNTRVLDLPEDRGQFSPDPTDTTYGGFFDQGVTETTAIIPAIPRHTSLQIETEYGLALDVGTESPGNQTFEIKVDGTPVYTRHYTWEQLGGGLWYNTGTTDDFHSGASKIISYANGTWPVLKVMHTASAATLTYSVDGLGPYDSWGISEVEVSATLPHIQPATYYSIAEGGQDGQFSISSDISDETLNVNVAFTGTATESVDYDTLPHEQTLPAGAPDVRTTIHAIDDQIIEGDETVTMQLLPGEGYGLLNSVLPYVPSSITATIQDNEGGFSVTPYGGPIHEAGGALQGGFTFHRDNTSGPLDVSYTVDTSVPDAATPGTDYQALPGALHFDDGIGEINVPLVPIDDDVPEPTEKVAEKVTQVGQQQAELRATQDIVEDKPTLNTLTVTGSGRSSTDSGSGAPILYIDGDANDHATINVSAVFTPSTKGAEVLWKVIENGNGSTPDHGDFQSQPDAVQLAADTFDPWTVEAGVDENGDDVLQDSEVTRSVVVRMGALVSIAASDALAAETDSAHPPDPGQFTISRDHPTPKPLAVDYTMSGTATDGTDYHVLGGSITIPANATSATIDLHPINDAIVEDTETAILTLSTPSGGEYVIDGSSSATVSIADNEPNVTIEAAAYASEQGPTPGRFTVYRNGDIDYGLNIGYGVSGTATPGDDYSTLGGSVYIPPGAYSASIVVNPVNDQIVEPPESVMVTLNTPPTGGTYQRGTPATATINILDNDGQTVLNSITATDTAHPTRTATNPNQTELYIGQPDSGDASITLSDVYTSTDQDPQQHILWQVVAGGATLISGNFTSNPIVTLSVANGNRTFLVQAGVDADNNGSLTFNEWACAINVYVVQVNSLYVTDMSDHFTTTNPSAHRYVGG